VKKHCECSISVFVKCVHTVERPFVSVQAVVQLCLLYLMKILAATLQEQITETS